MGHLQTPTASTRSSLSLDTTDSPFFSAVNVTMNGGGAYQIVDGYGLRFSGGNQDQHVVPSGTGSFMVAVPDSTTVGGNARGQTSIDLQLIRDAASKVASGLTSCIVGGQHNTASAYLATIVGGQSNVCSVTGTVIGGQGNSVTGGSDGVAIGGSSNNVTATGGIAIGKRSLADLSYKFAHSNGDLTVAQGEAQVSRLVMSINTSTAVATELSLDGVTASGTTNRLLIRANCSYAFTIRVVGRQVTGGNVGAFWRRGIIQNIGGTVSMPGGAISIGTDIGSNAGGAPATWAVGISADNTNKALAITVTGTAVAIKWVALIELEEIMHA